MARGRNDGPTLRHDRSKPMQPESVLLLDNYCDSVDDECDNGRDSELTELYTNQIYHASSRYKGPKVSDGYEELVVSQHPLQVIYPDKYKSTGLAYTATSKAMQETHNPTEKKRERICCCFRFPQRDYDPMVVYSSDNPEMRELRRYKFTHAGVWLFSAACLFMSIVLLLVSPFDFNNYEYLLGTNQTLYDVINVVATVLALLILLIGVVQKNPPVVLVFVIIFAIDAFVNLLRLYSVLQFIHFLFQLILLYLANYYRILISAQWYYSL